MAKHVQFVNGIPQRRTAAPYHIVCFVRVMTLCILFPAWVFGQTGDPPAASPLFEGARERLGEPSRIRWTEPGSNTLDRWTPRRIVEIEGVISEWEPSKLVLVQRQSNAVITFPGDNVVGLEPGWRLEAYAEVHKLYAAGKFSEVLQQGQAALKLTGAPRWQQRMLVAEMVEAASAMGQRAVAGRVFGYLAKDSPPDLLLATIPLPWADEALNAGNAIAVEAAKWMDEESDAMKLLGASWSLSGPLRPKALEILQTLAKSESAILSGYARAQLWRTVPPDAIRSGELPKWIELRDGLPMAAQAGPSVLLGLRLEQAGEKEMAIAEWLRVATLHADRFHLHRMAIERARSVAGAIPISDLPPRILQGFPEPKPSIGPAPSNPNDRPRGPGTDGKSP